MHNIVAGPAIIRIGHNMQYAYNSIYDRNSQLSNVDYKLVNYNTYLLIDDHVNIETREYLVNRMLLFRFGFHRF